MAERQITAAMEKEKTALVSGATGLGPRFRPKKGSVIPPKRKLVKTMMAKKIFHLLCGGSAGKDVSGHSAVKIPRVYRDDSPAPPMAPGNGHN